MTSDGVSNVPQVVQDECMGDSIGTSMPSNAESMRESSQFRTFLASGGYGAGSTDAQQSERANALRGAQLQDLLRTQGMWRPSVPSSSSSRAQPSIFKENDDNDTQRLITRLVEIDVKNADDEKLREHER